MKKFAVTALTLVLFAGGLVTMAQANWGVAKTSHIGGEGGWDYLTVDPETHRLYVPRTTHTMVLDGTSGKTVADIAGQIPGPRQLPPFLMRVFAIGLKNSLDLSVKRSIHAHFRE